MAGIMDNSGPDHKRIFRLSLLLVSTATILSISALFYARAVFQKALNVAGSSAGSGSSSTGINMTLVMIVVLALQAFVISLGVFGFPPKMPKGIMKTLRGGVSLTRVPQSKAQKMEEWEESSSENKATNANRDVADEILQSLRKNSSGEK